MSRIVIGDRRFTLGLHREGWKTLVKYNGRDIAPAYNAPKWLIDHFRADPAGRTFPGYVSFRGLTPKQALTVIALAKGAAVSLSINRWGEASCYKIRNL